ncbi:MAG TPA: FtsX-like permease family protein [Candidatus Limnocylindrales bacterium]
MTRSSATAIARIAWRNIRRSRGRSALIVLLVMLPVAAMAGTITLVATISPTREEAAVHRMGAAGYEVQQAGPPPADCAGCPAQTTTDSLRAALPAGSQTEPWAYDVVSLTLPGRTVDMDARSMDLDGLAHGMLTITDGRQPHNQQEVAISASVAALASVGIGDSIQLVDWGTLTVVGLVEDPSDIRGRLVLFDASVAREAAQGLRSGLSQIWLVSLPEGAEMKYTRDACSYESCPFVAVGRYDTPESSDTASGGILVLGGLALVEAVLVAAAAFAVGVRRRQRELGLLAATGAERWHLAGTVLSEGLLLGGLAALLGVGLGVLAVVGLSPWLDELTNHRVGPVDTSPVYLTLAGLIGLLACFLAAAVPARSAARLPVLLALSGRRPPLGSARRLLVIGVFMVVAGGVLTSIGAAIRLSDTDGSQATLSIVLLLFGAILGVLGFGTCSPWLVERLERLGLRLPVAARIALRDTARARSRNAPIVTAILAAFAATVAVSAYFASNDADAAAHWQPWLRADELVIEGAGAATAGPQAAETLGAIAGAPIPWLVGIGRREVFTVVEDRTAPTDEQEIAYNVTIGDANVLTAFGADSGLATLDSGGVVLVLPDRPVVVDDAIVTREPRSVDQATVVVRDVLTGDELAAVTVPSFTVATHLGSGGSIADAVISASTAEALGLKAGVTPTYLIRLPRPVAEADVAAAATVAAQQPNTRADASMGPTRPDELFRLLLVFLSLLFALTVTGIAVALGEAESRSDQRTLLAIGADPGIRRRISAARAGVLALMAGLLAVPAGLLPAWGLLGSRGAPLVVPLTEVVAAVIILPVAAILGALLLTRRIPAWSALREPAA